MRGFDNKGRMDELSPSRTDEGSDNINDFFPGQINALRITKMMNASDMQVHDTRNQ